MIDVIILAAGKGTRMKTDRPKALVEASGVPMLGHVLSALERSGLSFAKPHVVVGHRGEEVIAFIGDRANHVWQKEQKGTGHAVMMAQDALFGYSTDEGFAAAKGPAEHIVVLFADQPLISGESLRKLVSARAMAGDTASVSGSSAVFSMATVSPEHHDGDFKVFERNGRIVRDANGAVSGIVEYKDATDDIRALKEVNISAYCFDPRWLWRNLSEISDVNASGEYYLTDLVKIAKDKGEVIVPVIFPTVEGMGANSPEELVVIEKYL